MQQKVHEMTMKTLLVLRHAQAVHSSDTCDHDRALTVKGVKDAKRIGRLFRGVQPSHVICSSALRTVATAELALQVAKLNIDIQKVSQLYDSDLAEHLRILQEVSPTTDRLLVVGHNPTLESLVTRLARRPIVLQTGSLAIIAVAVDEWHGVAETPSCTLVGLFCPAMLKKQVDEKEE